MYSETCIFVETITGIEKPFKFYFDTIFQTCFNSAQQDRRKLSP